MNIILASQSPRRLFLLQAAGFDVSVRPSHVDETPLVDESVHDMTMRLCQCKAQACVLTSDMLLPVIAADTLVAIDGEALGQPKDLFEARIMIEKLSGKMHHVYTAVCVRYGDIYKTGVVKTSVTFRVITGAEIDCYLQHNDILDKAGAYAIQGGASSFIVAIEGDLDNVIGLPVLYTMDLLSQAKKEAVCLHADGA